MRDASDWGGDGIGSCVKIAGHTTGQSNMRQATSVVSNAAVAEMKCTSRAIRMVGSVALANK